MPYHLDLFLKVFFFSSKIGSLNLEEIISHCKKSWKKVSLLHFSERSKIVIQTFLGFLIVGETFNIFCSNNFFVMTPSNTSSNLCTPSLCTHIWEFYFNSYKHNENKYSILIILISFIRLSPTLTISSLN